MVCLMSSFEKQTAIANKASNAESLVPESVSPSVPLSLAFDNTDISEETLTGGGTFHGTSGCIIQQNTSVVQRTDILPQARTKHRSFKSSQSELQPYYSGKKVPPTPAPDVGTSAIDSNELQQSKEKNLAFVLQCSPHAIGISVPSSETPVASWTSFNHNTSDAICQKATVVQIPV